MLGNDDARSRREPSHRRGSAVVVSLRCCIDFSPCPMVVASNRLDAQTKVYATS